MGWNDWREMVETGIRTKEVIEIRRRKKTLTALLKGSGQEQLTIMGWEEGVEIGHHRKWDSN